MMETFFDDDIARMKFDFTVPGKVFLHLKPFAEGWRVGLTALKRRAAVKEELAKRGYDSAGVIFQANPRIQKLAELAGFKLIGTRNGWTYMEACDG